jgi:hypothetical protein
MKFKPEYAIITISQSWKHVAILVFGPEWTVRVVVCMTIENDVVCYQTTLYHNINSPWRLFHLSSTNDKRIRLYIKHTLSSLFTIHHGYRQGSWLCSAPPLAHTNKDRTPPTTLLRPCRALVPRPLMRPTSRSPRTELQYKVFLHQFIALCTMVWLSSCLCCACSWPSK